MQTWMAVALIVFRKFALLKLDSLKNCSEYLNYSIDCDCDTRAPIVMISSAVNVSRGLISTPALYKPFAVQVLQVLNKW